MGRAFDANTARLAVVGDDPMLLAEEDPEKVGRANKANSIAYGPARERITRFDINWNLVAWPGSAWARRVFPDLPEVEAVARLAAAVFAASRVDGDDPVGAWRTHNAALRARSDWMNGHAFHSLHFRGPGTDLTVGLADGHEWMGGASVARNGIICNPNIPSEEVFTTPHAARTEGEVASTKPLSHMGSLIEDIRVRFEGGRIVEAHAGRGEAVLKKLLDTDEGAARLGEVALVPHGSPISQSGVLFLNTLFDENAACHLALGMALRFTLEGGKGLDAAAFEAVGGNASSIHADLMVGSAELDIDGIRPDGAVEPLMRAGEWAFDVR